MASDGAIFVFYLIKHDVLHRCVKFVMNIGCAAVGAERGAIPFAGFDDVAGDDTCGDMDMTGNSLFGDERGTPALLTRGAYHNRTYESPMQLLPSSRGTAGPPFELPSQPVQTGDPSQRHETRQPPRFGGDGGGFDPDPTLFDAEANASQLWQPSITGEMANPPSASTFGLSSARGVHLRHPQCHLPPIPRTMLGFPSDERPRIYAHCRSYCMPTSSVRRSANGRQI